MRVIYISGQYRNKTIGGTFKNIMHARDAAIKLWNENWIVICPHLNTFSMDGLCPDNVWLKGDLEILRRCDSIYMLSGFRSSSGAMEEYKLALKLEKEILYEEVER